MPEDIRLAVDFFDHPKTRRLEKFCGPSGILCLIHLWCFCARYRPRGELFGLEEEEIACASGWLEDPGKFIEALLRSGFLDRNGEGILKLHDWEKWNSWSFHKEERTEVARSAAEARWSKHNAKRMRKACATHALGNAPSPSPNPKPTPNPTPSPPTPPKKKQDHVNRHVLGAERTKKMLEEIKQGKKPEEVWEKYQEDGLTSIGKIIPDVVS